MIPDLDLILKVMDQVREAGSWKPHKPSGYNRSRDRSLPRLHRTKATLHGVLLHLVENIDGLDATLNLCTDKWHVKLWVSDSRMFIPDGLRASAHQARIPASIPYDGYVFRSELAGDPNYRHDMTIFRMFAEE